MGPESRESQPPLTPPAHPGDRIGRYEIIAEIGRGGMGVVYHARDRDLGRDVALKCPWPAIAADPNRRQRFLREARAAASLSHPGIVQVFEAFELEGYPWIALQYVPGRDLDILLREKGRLPVDDVLCIGEDLAAALKSAHDHNILHRDVKPRNVLITPEGHALLGDFGLARVLSQPALDPAAPTELMTLTSDGTVLGTLPYMSPEQALGRPLDKRSDIFSLGAVLYEMCTGQVAFSQSERGSLYDAIIHMQPVPVSHYTYEVPDELERIIRKALAKLPEERYQDAADLIADLHALRRQREFGEYSATHPPAHDRATPAVRTGDASGSGSRPPRDAAASGASPSGPVPVTSVGPRPPRWIWLVTALITVAALVGVMTMWPFRAGTDRSSLPPSRSVPVTSADAWEGQPALSPDGTRIAYASDEDGDFDIYVTDIHGGTPLRLTDDPASDSYPVWFPDGGSLAFVSERGGEPAIWKIGQLGGGATPLIQNAGEPAISPDGVRIACVRAVADHVCIAVAPLSSPDQLTILNADGAGSLDQNHPAWSSDGRAICFATRHGLWVVAPEGGNARRLTSGSELDTDPAWSPNGQHIYFSSSREGTTALWRIALRGGLCERITLGTGRECQPSLSHDGMRLAYATQTAARSLVIAQLHDVETQPAGMYKETVLRNLADAQQPAFSPDGRMFVFVSDRAGPKLNLWLQSLENGLPAGSPRQLTDSPDDASNPVFSPDGAWIAYYRIMGEQRDVWVIPARGGQSIPFTDNPADDSHPAWSPDGAQLAFCSKRDGGSRLWVAPIRDGRSAGPAHRISNESILVTAPVWSPDGTWIAFVGTAEGCNEVWLIPADGSASARQLTRNANVTRVRWDAERGDLLACGTWGTERFTLRRLSPATGETAAIEPAIDLGVASLIPIFDFLPEQRRVVFTREELKGDVWLLEARAGSY